MTKAEIAEHHVRSWGRDYNESDDGYSDMEAEEARGWRAVAGWGEDGWDLGDWPYVVFYFREVDGFELLQICEGDRSLYRFATLADRAAAVDFLFLWSRLHGENGDEWEAAGLTGRWNDETKVYDGVEALEAGTLRVPERFRGPYGEQARARIAAA